MFKINQITVLGSGIMGHGIAQISSMAGYNVILRDIEQSFLDKAMDKIKWSVNKLVEKQKINDPSYCRFGTVSKKFKHDYRGSS
jgi:enoyl-CoA hydratase/3-hydroxyacyl-CoA dehydrogenase